MNRRFKIINETHTQSVSIGIPSYAVNLITIILQIERAVQHFAIDVL